MASRSALALATTNFPADPAIEQIAAPGDGSPPLLVQYWQVAKRWKWVIAGVVASLLAIGLVVTMLMPRQFTAISRLEIDREKRQVTTGETLESAEASRDLDFYQTQYALLESRSLAARVSRRLNLSSGDRFFDAHGDTPAGDTLFGSETGAISAESRAEREKQVQALLLRNISIRPIRGSALIDVAYTSQSPELSQAIANAWANEFIQSSMDRRYAAASSARTFLEGRLRTLRVRLEESERTLVNYASDQGIVPIVTANPDGGGQTERTLVSTNLDTLNQALTAATADRIAAQSRTRQGGLSLEALNNSAITALRQRRAEAAADYARLSSQFEPGYPQLDALRGQIESLDLAIQREESRVQATRSSTTSREYDQALARENALRAQVENLKANFETQRRAGIQYNIFQREVDTNRELYNGLLQRYKEIGVAGVGANNISIVDRAELPSVPSSPNIALNLALALLAGLAISGAVIFGLEQIDEGIKDPGDVMQRLGQPLLGGVPAIDDESVTSEIEDSKSVLSEAYLSIWSNLAFSTDHGVPRSFMVTSTKPGEGKSTSTIALAVAIGRTGKTVALVDGDMRSPSIHGLLNGSNERGLSNYLAGDTDWRGLLQPTPFKGVDMMAAGPRPPSAGELLSSNNFEALVTKLIEAFDCVIVDAPPVLGLADAPLMARHVEGVVYVAEVENAPAREIRASIARLKSVHSNLVGVIVTKLGARSSGYGYGYGYGYGSDDRDA